jgi:hypothetical protein
MKFKLTHTDAEMMPRNRTSTGVARLSVAHRQAHASTSLNVAMVSDT